MKAGKLHRIPLTAPAIDVLRHMEDLCGNSGLVFKSHEPWSPLSDMALLSFIRRLHPQITTHGFRSTFRDWASETTNFSREVIEMALAHTIENKVEAAYRRGDLFEKRRELMNAWGTFMARPPGKVLPFNNPS